MDEKSHFYGIFLCFWVKKGAFVRKGPAKRLSLSLDEVDIYKYIWALKLNFLTKGLS